MHRLRKFALAALVALTFTACDEGKPLPIEPEPPPDPVGMISGTVTIDGSGAAGLTATLSSGATQTTNTSGAFSFADVVAGSYTVTISGHPEDVTFPAATQSATIASNGQTVQLNFPGQYIRSSSVVGNVVAADAMMSASGSDSQPETLAGVTVTLTGEHAMAEPQETNMETGGYVFTGLRAGTYTVTISNYPEDVKFDEPSMTIEVGVGEVGTADFEGAFIRTAAIEGRVIIEGEGLAGVMVTLVGGPGNDSYTKTTGPDGEFAFTELRPGDYQVSISGYDAEDYEFASNSHDVSVDLDETETVSFTGVLLRTSGISGRVGVPGMGLPDITVTLSGAADTTTVTDASGQYSFAGLAAGAYTVSIAVTSDAYVFESMSSDVTLGDDDSQIVNFEGAHATTASVSGMLFLDELDKNDAHDAGEHPLAQAGIPLALVGPGVNDQRLSATGPDGTFMFPGLRKGSYQLVVPIDATVAAALAAADIKYGGPGVGYGFALEVGERKTQAVPFDITHTTVNFTVSLKSGEETGDALSGASVSLYGAGNAMVGSGMTGDDGSVAIKVARDRTSGNMVNAGVSADGYDVADGMTAVSWDPQMFATAGANSNDIVNLNVNVNVNGATVDRGDYGGGEALADWAISVMSGDAAVPGAPTALGSDGSVAFTTTVASVPASFTFAAAEDQDDELDGGEMYESSGGMYKHTGLSVAGTAMDADPIVVTYTTQTLKVYVHHERDQVRGYTGNALDGDVRMSGLVDIEIRHVSGNNDRLTRPFSSEQWDSRANSRDSRGVYTFAHLPANMNVVVRADAKAGFKLLDAQELDTYRDMDANGVMGGAFGDMVGGWGHTVSLCPLTEVEPTGQDFGKCGSFAIVSLHNVKANVSKMRVRKVSSGPGFNSADPSTTHESGVTVSLTPVPGKNLDGDARSFTTAKDDDPTTAINERTDHNFGTMAAGAYKLGLPDGWRAMVGEAGAAGALSPLESDVQLDVTPSTATFYGVVRNRSGFGLETVTVTVNGMTATTDNHGRYIVTGIPRVRGQYFVNTERAGFPETQPDSTNNPNTTIPAFAANMVHRHDIDLYGANNTVTISGLVTESGTGTPIKGVRIKVDKKDPLNGLPSGRNKGQVLTGDDGKYVAVVEAPPLNDLLVDVSVSKSGWHFLQATRPVPAIPPGSDGINFQGSRAAEITGRVTAPGSDMPMRDIKVTAYGDAGMSNALDNVTTTEHGTFSLLVPTTSGTVYLGARPLRLRLGEYGPTTYSTQAEYDKLVDADNYVWFDPPTGRSGGAIAVIPGQPLNFGVFTGNSVQPRITKVERVTIDDPVEVAGAGIIPERDVTPGNPSAGSGVPLRGFDLVMTEPTDTIEVTWQYETRNTWGAATLLPHTAEDDDGTGGGDEPTLETGAAVAALDIETPFSFTAPATTSRGTAANGTTVRHTRTTTYDIPTGTAADYGGIDLTIGHNVTGAPDGANVVAVAAEATGVYKDLAAVDGSVRTLEPKVKVTGRGSADDPEVHGLTATWDGAGSPQLQHRIALEVFVEDAKDGSTVNKWEWVVFDGRTGDGGHPVISRATDSSSDIAKWGQWSSESFDINSTTNAAGDWQDDDNAGLIYEITPANLKRARSLRVDTQVDGDEWVKHGSVTIGR